MADWNKRIAKFSKDKQEEASDVDKELQNLAKGGGYGYEQPDYEKSAFSKHKDLHQAYDQESKNPATDKTPIMSEAKDHYDTIDPERDDDDDEYNNDKEQRSEEKADEPITRKTIIELLICVSAFIGRGLCLNSVGPTLIDLRQIAYMTITQSAWIFVSQSIGFLLGSILSKVILQRFNNSMALSICLLSQALFTALIPAFRSMAVMCIMFVGQGFSIGVVGIGVCSICIRLGGKARNGMFLQAVYFGVSVGSVIGPFVARPFLSNLARNTVHHKIKTRESPGLLANHTLTDISISNNTTSPVTVTQPVDAFTHTHVWYYYLIIAIILCIPAVGFFIIYLKRDKSKKHTREEDKSEALTFSDLTLPLVAAMVLMFLQCFLYFGMQDTYSNLLTTFAVLGPIQMSKTNGVYLTATFWGSMAFGRLNGIWIAKLISPFKMLLIDMSVAGVAATMLMLFGGKYAVALWVFSPILGLSFATINGATVSWAAKHLPGNNYILSLIMVGRCVGLLTLPTTTTALFKTCGTMTLMYALFIVVMLMLIALGLSQTLAYKFGVNSKLHTRSQMKKLTDNSDSDSKE